MLDDGWTFATDFAGTTGDTLYGLPFLRDIYTKADPAVSGRVTVPILWDRQRETIVSNESSEIIRMFNSAFDRLTGNTATTTGPPTCARRSSPSTPASTTR